MLRICVLLMRGQSSFILFSDCDHFVFRCPLFLCLHLLIASSSYETSVQVED
jgi:hypothetical protein